MYRLSFLIALCSLTASCQNNNFLRKINTLPSFMEEISGITYSSIDDKLYAINDSGNSNSLYQLSLDGEVRKEIKLHGTKNVDWEDIARDPEGNIYVGDFGNNDNDRKDLVIYKVTSPNESQHTIAKIEFTLEDQTQFPPKKKHRNFDIEAFIYLNGSFYLFTKNRSKTFDGTTKLYKLPAKEGKHIATLISSYRTGGDAKDCFITAASINKAKDKIALLTYNKIYILSNFSEDNLFDGTVSKIKLKHYSQKEGITFINDSTLYISDERSNKTPSSIYQYILSE